MHRRTFPPKSRKKPSHSQSLMAKPLFSLLPLLLSLGVSESSYEPAFLFFPLSPSFSPKSSYISCVIASPSLSLSCELAFLFSSPQWGAADAEIKVPFGENTELKRSPFKVWSRSVYSHTCYAYCQEFLPRLFPPFRSIHLHFFQNLSQFFPVLAVANTGSSVGPKNKIGHPVECRFPCWVPAEYK